MRPAKVIFADLLLSIWYRLHSANHYVFSFSGPPETWPDGIAIRDHIRWFIESLTDRLYSFAYPHSSSFVMFGIGDEIPFGELEPVQRAIRFQARQGLFFKDYARWLTREQRRTASRVYGLPPLDDHKSPESDRYHLRAPR